MYWVPSLERETGVLRLTITIPYLYDEYVNGHHVDDEQQPAGGGGGWKGGSSLSLNVTSEYYSDSEWKTPRTDHTPPQSSPPLFNIICTRLRLLTQQNTRPCLWGYDCLPIRISYSSQADGQPSILGTRHINSVGLLWNKYNKSSLGLISHYFDSSKDKKDTLRFLRLKFVKL